jgi:tripartite-type tricarboxylate transporter receptor subunit TctC
MRRLPRRTFLHLTAGAVVGLAIPRLARAEAYPSRPVRLIVGFPPGSAADIVARVVAQSLSERLGQQVVVENRPGASTNIATEVVVRSPPDGYTILMVTVPNAINGALYANLNFNFIRDIAPVAGFDRSFFVMVTNPAFPARTVAEFIAYAKANPGKVDMASNGIGTVTHMAGALFMAMSGVELVHVPYSGNFFTDLISGKVNVAFSPVAAAIGSIKDGSVRALAVTSATRSEMFPNVPAIAEFIPGYEASLLDGFGAPKNTPAEIIDKLNNDITAVLADPKVKARLADFGSTPMPMAASEFGNLVADQTKKWARVITEAGIKTE